jgi:hypothetical protein
MEHNSNLKNLITPSKKLLKSYDLLNNNNNKPEYEKPKEESFLFY